MAITVREALSIGGLNQAILLAGHRGLDRTISCVDILEVPDSSGWLRPNELVVTTCYAVRDNAEAQLNIIRVMAEVNSAVLAVKFDRFIGTVPPRMCELADELNIPLLNIPNGVSFMEITLPVMTAIINAQSLQLQYSEEVRSKMIQTSLEANSLTSVAETLTGLIKHDVIICNAELQCLVAAGNTSSDHYQFFSETIQPQPSGLYNTVVGWAASGERVFASFAITVRRRCYGYILVDLSEPLTELHSIAIEHAITVAAVQMVKEEAVVQAQKSYHRDLLEDLISGAFKSKELAFSRAEALGLSLNKPQIIVVIDFDNFSGFIHDEESAAYFKSQLAVIVSNCVHRIDWRALVVQRSDSVVVIMAAPLYDPMQASQAATRKLVRQLAENIQKKVREQFSGVTVSIGISSLVDDPLAIAPQYQEVRNMIRLMRKMQGEGRIAFWEDVEFYSLLANLGQPLERFYEAKLGKLDRPAIKNREELITTLKLFLECQGNTVETADKLFIHRNTLRYRLQRIEQIIGVDLSQPDERFTLWLAIKVRSLLKSRQ